MNQLPDAPWIRDAELNGYPANDPVHCPVCHRECEYIYLDASDGEVVGCDECIQRVDASDWWYEHKEDGRDDW